MSRYHLIPTFSFAPRGRHPAQEAEAGAGALEPAPAFNPHHMMNMMDTLFAHTGNQGLGLTPRARGFGQIHIGDDPAKFELSFDLGRNCKPEDVDINIKLIGEDSLQIEARHETGSIESGEYRNHYFSKTIMLPDGIDIEGLKSSLTEHGELRVEAPMKAIEEPKPAVREIKIQRMSSDKK